MTAGLTPGWWVFVLLVGGVSVLGLLAGRSRGRGSRGGEPVTLERWALDGRRYGTVRTWFLLGGAIFTAYTFVAVPALTYGVGALGFFAVPYTVMVFPLAYVVLPRLWRVAARHGWTTPADIARGRYGSPTLGLAVALTGLLATMPYIALQLLGLGALLTVLGIPSDGVAGDLALTATFAVLAVGTYRYGLRTPSLIAVVKGVLIFLAAGVTVAGVLHASDGVEAVFAAAGPVVEERTGGGGGLLLDAGLGPAYVSLAAGSAVALLLYPHVLTCAFAARDEGVLRRNSIGLLAWTALLGVLALLGLAAAAAGVVVPPGHAELALPELVRATLPWWATGLVLGAIGIGALVPAAIMSVASGTLFASNVYVEYIDPTADGVQQAKVARVVSVVVKAGALVFALALPTQDAITLQLLGGVWILQTLPAVLLGLFSRRPHRYAVLAGMLAGLVLGTALVARDGFVAVTVLSVGGLDLAVYSAVVALAVNLVLVAALTPVLDAAGVSRGVDATGVSVPWAARSTPASAREWEGERW
jgi:SSS family solute:Na+ symporter